MVERQNKIYPSVHKRTDSVILRTILYRMKATRDRELQSVTSTVRLNQAFGIRIIVVSKASMGCWENITNEELMTNQFRAYASPILGFIGVPANTLTFIVFYVMNKRNPCRFNFYALALMVTYNVQLITNALLDDFVGRGLSWITQCRIDVQPDTLSSFSCKTITFFTECSALTKAFVLMFFSVDRVYAVYNTVSPQSGILWTRIGIIICCVVCMVMNIPQLIYVDRVGQNDGTYTCRYLNPLATGVQYVLYLYIVGATLVPSVLVFITSLCILVRMKTIIDRSKIRGDFDKASAVEFGKVITHLIISILFTSISFPLVVAIILRQQVYIWGYDNTNPVYATRIVELSKLCSSIDTINYACEFFIYVAFMPEFRETLVQLFTCKPCTFKWKWKDVVNRTCSTTDFSSVNISHETTAAKTEGVIVTRL
ncbi:G-protein coupled receptor fragment [Clonorchis sinensis]|uniref:G-protein coupled receptor n=1 Tax=Clonorchis sinensis TaxID=79923 RepID=H2KPV5_CLOSI|nr:G-protein coupled receptor fragment [Clonorchis sinensis]